MNITTHINLKKAILLYLNQNKCHDECAGARRHCVPKSCGQEEKREKKRGQNAEKSLKVLTSGVECCNFAANLVWCVLVGCKLVHDVSMPASFLLYYGK